MLTFGSAQIGHVMVSEDEKSVAVELLLAAVLFQSIEYEAVGFRHELKIEQSLNRYVNVDVHSL
jgi:hypothetical protein